MVTTLLTIAIDGYVALFRQAAAQAIAWALLQFVWQGALIGALTAVALFVLRPAAADVRYIVASIGLALIVTLPVVTGVQKYGSLRVASAQGADLDVFATARISREGNQDLTPTAVASTLAESAGAAASKRSRNVGPALMLLWLAGVTALTLRLITGWIRTTRTRTRGIRPVEPAWDRRLEQLARRLHIARAIALFESTRVDVPTVIGWLKPVVLLPASAIAALSPAQLEAVLAHELAHIRRHDYLVNLMQTVVETLLFYHPAVWWISRRIRIERENCCDDLAVRLCGDAITYVDALAELESLRSPLSSLRHLDRTAMAATGGSLLHRVRRLLGAPTAHSGAPPAWLAASAALLLAGGMTVAASSIAPTHAAPPPRTMAGATNQSAAHHSAADQSIADQSAPAAPAAPAPPSAPLARAPRIARTAPNAELPSSESAASAPAVASAPPAAPAAPDAPSAPSAPQGNRQSHSNGDSHGNWSWSNGSERLQADYSGSFEFTDDDTDVRQMTPGSRLRISDGTWQGMFGGLLTPSHLVEITERNGQIEHRYLVNGAERPYDPEGREWLRQNLPKFVRNTGVNAPARVARALKSGGVPAVLAEIDKVDGNYVRGIYYRELFKQATLSPEQYRQALSQMSTEMRGANYELSQMLIALADRLPNDDATRTAYFNAASSLTGAYETGRVYSTILKKGAPNAQTVGAILDHLKTLHSDYEVSQLLLDIIAQQPLDARNGTALLDVAAGMHGDYERGRVLTAFLKQNSIEGTLRDPFFRSVNAIRGAYERGQILQAVVSRPDAGHDSLKLAIQATRNMPPYETSQVLLRVANRQAITGDLRDAYIDAADRLGAYEQGQVMTALVKSERRSR